ncbi:aromatic-ring-hydroxylating dioxygenase subunit beta [Mycobacterium seoulense]|uniref:aromatic-ring-hydroxylating dioxygenase subunit beta n=1 Tax=Mycobacterium seoulense TaxID=386911 RepID=UPI003CEDF67A
MTAEATPAIDAQSAAGAQAGIGYPAPRGERVPVTDPRHLEILAFLEEESALLDADDLTGWLGLLAPDIVYRAPVRTTRDHRTRGVFEPDMYLFNENIMTLMMKIMRMTQTDSAWAENPLSRTHRIVHKIRAYRTDMPDEYEVHSSVLLLRSRYDDPKLETLPARRVDIIRTGEEWKIASRTVFFDQATLGVQNLAIYV